MKKCFCKLQASVPIHSTTGGYANLEGSLQIKNCRKYAQHAIKCNFLYQSHTQGSFISIFPLILHLFSSGFSLLTLLSCYFLSGREPIWWFFEDLVWPGAAPWNALCSMESLSTAPSLIHHKLILMKGIWTQHFKGHCFLPVWWNSNMLATPSVPKGQEKHPRVQELHEGWRITSSSLCPPASSQHSWIWLSFSNQSPWPVKRFFFPWFYLFNVEEVLGIEGDGSAWDRNIFIQSPTVTHIGLDSKCYWFGLQTEKHIKKHWELFSHKNPAPIISPRPAEFSSLENIPI